MWNRWIIRVLTALALAATLPRAVSAFADGGEVSRRGACSGRSDWQLEVRKDDEGLLRVRFEIGGGAPRQDWHVFMSDNGTRIFSGRRTSGSGGHVEVRVRTANRVGPDAVKAAANNVVTAETCAGRVAF